MILLTISRNGVGGRSYLPYCMPRCRRLLAGSFSRHVSTAATELLEVEVPRNGNRFVGENSSGCDVITVGRRFASASIWFEPNGVQVLRIDQIAVISETPRRVTTGMVLDSSFVD